MELNDTQRMQKKKESLDAVDKALIANIQNGLPITEKPYATIANEIGISEEEVFKRISNLKAQGLIKRFGVVVRHHELGYNENAMVVWDVSDQQVQLIGEKIKAYPFITLCYRRSRQPPEWPYNLYCMIHGKSRDDVMQLLQEMIDQNQWQAIPHEVLFSKRRFKQCAANYVTATRQRNERTG